MSNQTLSLKNVSLTIGGKKRINSVSLEVNQGEIILLCGGSGSGKSTLANIINGYFPEYGGKLEADHIKISDKDVQHLTVVERSESVRTIFQHARLSFSMKTLREEMVFCLENSRVDTDQMDDIIEEKAGNFNLTYLLDRSFDDLSGGELQRAAFVCADLVDVPLYIMDEPFANVDEATMQDYIRYMKELTAKGKAIIVIDHHIKRWEWVGRWLLLDSKQHLHDLSLIDSEKEKNALLVESGLLVEALAVPERNIPSEEILLVLDKVSIYHEKIVRKSLFRKEKQRNTLIEEAKFNLNKGSLTALVGPSGIGKTSLFKAILNVSPYTGEIRLQGQSVKGLKPKNLYGRIGLVFQDPSLQFVKTNVLDELALSLTSWDLALVEEAKKQAQDILSQHHFEDKAGQSPWLLSQGQQRRLAVLCMTVGNQNLLLIDEPTYGQDARNGKKIMDKLHELCQKGITCLFTSHDRELVDAYASQIFEIKEKKVRQVR